MSTTFNIQPEQTVGEKINVHIATAGERIAASLIDTVTYCVAAAPFLWASFAEVAETAFDKFLWATLVLYGIIFLLNIIWLGTRGQTIGKRLMNIKIIKTNGNEAGFIGAVLLRIFAYALLAGIVTGISAILSEAAGNGMSSLLTLINIISLFAQKDRRVLWDLLAGTVVVQLPPRK